MLWPWPQAVIRRPLVCLSGWTLKLKTGSPGLRSVLSSWRPISAANMPHNASCPPQRPGRTSCIALGRHTSAGASFALPGSSNGNAASPPSFPPASIAALERLPALPGCDRSGNAYALGRVVTDAGSAAWPSSSQSACPVRSSRPRRLRHGCGCLHRLAVAL